MINIKKIFILVILTVFLQSSSYSDVPYFVDFKLILNKSIAGKDAQDFLKKKLNNGIASIKKKRKTNSR